MKTNTSKIKPNQLAQINGKTYYVSAVDIDFIYLKPIHFGKVLYRAATKMMHRQKFLKAATSIRSQS